MASFYDSASIITIPSGYKAGTLYSAKPTDGSGDMAFTRTGDTATRVNSAGIIERCITNSLSESNNFVVWSKTNTTITAGITDPNGGTTATSMEGTSSTSNTKNLIRTGFSTTSDVKTFSVYAKAGTHSFIQLRGTVSSLFVNFDLTTGTFSNGPGGFGTMVSLGNGWYRCIMVMSATTNSVIQIQLVDSLSAVFNENSVSTNSVYIWRAQAQLGNLATNYIDTTTAAVTEGPVTNLPRLDYLGSTCPQLLMEPTRTNLETYSQMFDNAAWTKTNSSVSGNVVVSPDGYTNADKLIDNSTNDRHQISRSITPTTNTTYTFSCFVKKAELDYVILSSGGSALTGGGGSGADRIASVNLNNGSIVTNNYNIQSVNYGNGWYRVSINLTTDSDGGTFSPYIATSLNGTSNSYIGSGQGIFIWGAQVEVGAYATSYIPTTAATVTRNVERATKESISSLIGQTEGTIFIDIDYIRTTSDLSTRMLTLRDSIAESSNGIVPLIQGAGANANQFQLAVFGGVGDAIVIPSSITTLIPFGRNKIALAYNNGSYVLYRNGNLITTATGPKPSSTLTAIDLGNRLDNTRSLANPINQALLFKTRLSNDELATLTTL